MTNFINRTERINRIKEIAKTKNRINISDLSSYFNVSRMTIYRDLKILEVEKKLIITKKGIVYIDNAPNSEYPHNYRLERNKSEKKAIAKKAIDYINDNETIFLDGSTTALHLAKLLVIKNHLNLTIITISPLTVLELSKNKNIQILCTGGILNNTNYSFYKDEAYIKNININKAFISCSGFSVKKGFTEAIREEAKLKKILTEHCPEINIIADYTKYNVVTTYTFGSLKNVRRIIVDNKLDIRSLVKLKESSVEVVVA